MIYTDVFNFDHSSGASTVRQYEMHCGTRLPTIIHLSAIAFNWLDLMRTNGRVADEMRQLYHMPSRHTTVSDQTWSMQLILNNDEYTLGWTSLPCPSSCVRHLSIDLKINITLSMFGHWDNDNRDKPRKLFAALMELLTQVSRRGPNFAVSETLPRPIIFETLCINISFADEEKAYPMSSGPELVYIIGYGKRRIYSQLVEDMVFASGNGGLEDKFKSVKLHGPRSLGLPKTEIMIAHDDKQ